MEHNELEIFNEMCELAKHMQNHQQIVKAIMDKLSKAVEYTAAVILILDEEEIITNIVYPSTKYFLDSSIKLICESLPQDIKERKSPENFKKIIYEDIENTNYDREEFNEVKSYYIIPLIIRDKTQGFLGITSGEENLFTKREEEILTIFANQSAILIDNAKLYSQTEQRIAEMSILHEVGKVLSSILNLDRLLNIIVERSAELSRATRVSIMLYDSEKEKFIIKISKGLPPEIIKDTVVHKNEGITGYVIDTKKSILVRDITKEEPFSNLRNKKNYVTNSFMSFPLVIRYHAAGVLHVSNKINGATFDNEDFELLDTFIFQARAAIENSMLYGEMEQLAITDGLTHIYNHRYFQEQLAREIKRANRYKLNISVLMIDIDYFKQYNDKYGHPKGDQVLKKVALLVKKFVRNVDIVARYGGEEFIVIMPETDAQDSYDVAERIRKKIMSEKFPDSNKEIDEKITISIGVASYSKNNEKTRDEIIEKADQSLYQAKKEGRNKVCQWKG
ncbi:MAG: diguanylate cyclase [Candidatus Firestonebacteria bacterium]|nr:diguanylate cyclase [Candidatus Firestonebacteria bacterium]